MVQPKPLLMDPHSHAEVFQSSYLNKLRGATKGKVTSPLLALELVLEETNDIVSELNHQYLADPDAERQARDKLLLRTTALLTDIKTYLKQNTRYKYLLKRSRHEEYAVSLFALEVVRSRLARGMGETNMVSTIKAWEEIAILTKDLYWLIQFGPEVQPESIRMHSRRGMTTYLQMIWHSLRRRKVDLVHF
ncbi:hypothetical protein N7451_012522 [Penicillium sp. IBT 35674x]|nr:hypothetical protein N7451_012522 [Penicillium sp. IBT 35674x]